MGIVWGPEIEVNYQERPDWVGDQDPLFVKWGPSSGNAWSCLDDGCYRWKNFSHSEFTHIRLPADHPYYAEHGAQPPTATEDSGPFVTVRMMTKDEAREMFLKYSADMGTTFEQDFLSCLRELGLIREETTLDRYFADKAMTQGERDAVTSYAAWVGENG